MRSLNRLPITLVALYALLISPLLLEGADQPSARQPSELSLLDSTSGRLLLELSVPDFTLEQIEIGEEQYLSLTAGGLSATGVPGELSIPELGLLVGLPPTGGWSVQVVAAEGKTIPLDLPLAPTLAPVRLGSEIDPFRPLPRLSSQPAGDAAAAALSLPVIAGDASWMRDLRVLPLRLLPFRYHPDRNELEYLHRLVVEITFDEPGPLLAAGGGPRPDSWDDLFEQFVVNYDVARSWRSAAGPARAAQAATPSNPPAVASGSLKIELDADGLYQLSYAELAAAGFSLAGDPADARLMVGGQEVPILVLNAAGGPAGATWDSGDRILFYGQAAQSRFTDINVYWLYQDGSAGARMAARAVNPGGYDAASAAYQATLHREENYLYDSAYPEANGDHWYWTDLRALQTGCPDETQSYSFSLSHLSSAGSTARLRASLQGYTDGTHDLAVSVNGHAVAQHIVWTNQERKEAELTLDPAWLQEGENELKLANGACPALPVDQRPANGMAFNYFEIDYPASRVAEGSQLLFTGEAGELAYDVTGLAGAAGVVLLDISDPLAPVQLTGGQLAGSVFRFQDSATQPRQYLAVGSGAIVSPQAALDQTSNLLTTTAGAGYVLIAYGEFLPATQPLLDLRAQNWVVAAVDIQDVYDEFSYGLLDPEAIRTFLRGLTPLPDHVLLVGDGTIDYHDHLGHGWSNYLPAYPADVDPYEGETASDHRLAELDGDETPTLPDLHIGRLPVSSVSETQAVVAKIVNYETDPAFGTWNSRVLFVADNTDEGGPFADISDGVYYDSVSPELSKGRIHLTENPDELHEYDPGDSTQVDAARAAVRRGFEAGQLVINFFGHSSHSQWTTENILHRDNTADLQNDGRLPVVLSFTCYTAAFHYPPYAPLDERLVLEPGAGAVAAWGSTGEGVLPGHRRLAQGFHQAIADSAVTTLGIATYAGQAELFSPGAYPANQAMLDTYVLLGDPAMSLGIGMGNPADMVQVFLPLVTR